VPGTVRDAVLARAAVLAPAAREALEAVAVFPVSPELAIVQAGPEAIDACVHAGALVREGAGIRFRHELARMVIEARIAPGRRAELHAQALEDLRVRGAEPARLAYHAEEAGDSTAVLAHAPEAARRAALVSAHRQAADHYAQALRHAGCLPARDRAEILEAYAETCSRLDLDEGSLEASREALECWREEGDQVREAVVLAQRSHYLWQATGDTDDSRASADAALELARRLPPGRGLVAAHTWSAVLKALNRETVAAIEVGCDAVRLAEEYGERALLSRALNAVGSARWGCDPDQAERDLVRSLEVARECGDDSMIGAALINLGSGAGEVRRYAVAREWLHEAIAWCSAHDMDSNLRYATTWLARCDLEQGRWSQASRVLDGAAPKSRRNRIVALTVLGRLRVRRGDRGAAETLDEAWALAEPIGDLQRLWPIAAGRAELAWLQDRAVDGSVRDTYDFAVRIGHGWAIGELGRWLCPDPDSLPSEAAAPYRLGPVDQAAAWDELGCPYEAALAYADSPDHLLEARIRFERLGARPAAERVARMLRDRGVRGPRRSTLVHPAGLTAREADVMDLLRLGLRKAEIAERLHIAVKTVDHHVSAILAKLGVRNRREVALRYGEIANPT
jgi:DNA-binding CsgD family transcriptional regulator